MERLISLQAAIDAIEETNWYHQNKNKDMVHGANSQEHQAWYKAEDIYQALDRLPSVQPEKVNEQIKKAVVDAIKNADVCVAWDDGTDDYDIADIAIRATKSSVIKSIEELPSAQPEPDTRLYSDGFDDGYKQAIKDAQPEPDIIACGDCKHYICHNRRCGYWNHGVKPLEWCCHAERREEGDK